MCARLSLSLSLSLSVFASFSLCSRFALVCLFISPYLQFVERRCVDAVIYFVFDCAIALIVWFFLRSSTVAIRFDSIRFVGEGTNPKASIQSRCERIDGEEKGREGKGK